MYMGANCVFVNFPFISYGRSFLTEEHKCDYFSAQIMTSIVSCVHIPNAIKVTKFRIICDEAVIFNISKQNSFLIRNDRRAPEEKFTFITKW